MEVYADNAATTTLSERALDAMLPYLRMSANPSSLHRPGLAAGAALEDARERIAACLNASPREIWFTSGGTEADNQALLTAASIGKRQGKMHILTSAFEHHAVLNTLKKLEGQGFIVETLDVHEDGLVVPQELEAALRPDTSLVSVMYANNEIGTIQPIREIGQICKKHGILFHSDAVQAAGQLPLDMQALGLDLSALSAHKFHGPKGTGLLYARRGIHPERLMEGGAQERGKRPGTENLPGVIGMAAALEEATEEREALGKRLTTMRDRLIHGLLAAIPHAALNGDPIRRLPGNVNLCIEGVESEVLLLRLDQLGIFASAASACTAGSLEPSHVMLAIHRPYELAHSSLRLSLSRENTDEEIDYLLKEIPQAVAALREQSPLWLDRLHGRRSYLLP